MDIRRITEVGVAVRDLEAATGMLVDLLGGTAGPVVEVERYAMRFRMVRVGKIDFELMEPTGDGGVIADFLAKQGEGLHHIAFAVDDLQDTMDTLRAKKVAWVDPEPIANRMPVTDYAGRTFDDGEIRFAFTHPRSIMGILFEFIQYPEGYQTP
ncbi:MAG: VOC family protein [Acidimicrobiales bacterium]|nr:VOC family protein [Acidimicrobiales bacterium]